VAIKPIGFYGKFRGPGVDTSAQRRMAALAGLADTVQDIAVGYGKAKREEEAVEKGIEAGKVAAETGVYKPVSTFKFGGEKRNAAALVGFLSGIQNTYTKIVSEAEQQFPDDHEGFISKANGALKGLTADIPAEWQLEVADYVSGITNSAGERILTSQIAKSNDANLAEFNTAQAERNNFELNLAYEGNLEELAAMALKTQKHSAAGIEIGFLKANEFNKNRMAHNKTIRANIVRGQFSRSTINNDAKTLPEKIKAAEDSIASIEKQSRLQVENHLDPGNFVLLSPDEKESIVKTLKTDLKDFTDAQIKMQEGKTTADKLEKIQNYRVFQNTVRDEDLSDEQKIANIYSAEIDGKIDEGQARVLRGYVNSAKALNAVTNASEFGNIISQVYDLNAELDLNEEGETYLAGLANIEEQIMALRSAGNLSEQDEKKIRGQIDNLVNAKKAKATIVIRENWYEATNALKVSLPPELVGIATRDLFEAVEAEKQRLIDSGMSIEAKNEMELWKRLAPKVAQSVMERERDKAFGKLSGGTPELSPEDQSILDKYIRNQ
jgi:hypothetical protein